VKILFYYEQRGYGGVDTHMAHLINNWPNSQDKFIVVSNPDNIGLEFFKNKITGNNVDIVTIDNVFVDVGSTSFKLFNYFLAHFKFIFKFRSLLKDVRPDIFVVNNGGFPGGMTCWIAAIVGQLSKITRKKTFFLIHHAPAHSRKFFNFYAIFLAKWLCWLNVPAITVSYASKRALEEYTPLRKIKVIYNGLETSLDNSEMYSFVNKFQISKDKVIIGMIGSIDSHKGHKVIIEAFRLSNILQKKAHVVFVGSGEDELVHNLRNAAREYKIENLITFSGFLPGDPLSIVSGFDVLVMPTIDFEGFGYSMAEAMFAGVPVIASDVGAIPEVIEKGKSGLLVDPSDVAGWRLNMEKLVENKALRRQIGELGMARVIEKFSANNMSQLYYNFMTDYNSNDKRELHNKKSEI
jgi:L-malate glycosyltransferase